MSDCGVCIGGDDYDYPEFHDVTWPVARKAHKCCECSGVIAPGQKYQRVSGKWDGRIDTYNTCSICAEIREAFSCGQGWIYTQLWEDMWEVGFDQMNSGCLAQLKTAAAKAELVRRWNEWKFR